MTKEELKATIDELIGMVSVIDADEDDAAALRYTSPTGVVLFSIHIILGRDGWRFGGSTSVLPDTWRYLCDAHRIAFV